MRKEVGLTLPSGAEGGLAIIRVHLNGQTAAGQTASLEGILRIFCLLGKAPKDKMEGGTLSVISGPKFRTIVGEGASLFVHS